MLTDWTERIRLRHLKFLLNVAETGSLSRSASLLHTTQPALSKWLRELETDTGLTLFERHARGLCPTLYGEMLIEHARRIDAQLSRAAVDMTVLRDGGSGRVVLGASGAAVSGAAPRALLAMVKRFPDIRVDLQEGTTDDLLALLSQGDLDLVIGRSVGTPLEHPNISAEVLYDEPIDLVARSAHPLFNLPKIDWNDVLSYRWVIWPRHTPIRSTLEAALAAANHDLPKYWMESNSVTANIALISTSNFIGNASRRATTTWTNGGLLRVIPLALGSYGSVSVYWRNDEKHPRSMQQTLECVREAVKDESPTALP